MREIREKNKTQHEIAVKTKHRYQLNLNQLQQ